MQPKRFPVVFWLVGLNVTVLGAGCTGQVSSAGAGGTGEGAGTVDDTGTTGGPGGGGVNPVAPASVVVRRLNRSEYDNTIRDLFGVESSVAQDFPSDETALGFDNIAAALTVPNLLAERYVSAGESVARSAVAKAEALVDCAPSATDACAAKFINQFAERAWRRPLAAEESQTLQAIYLKGKQREGFKTGLELVIRSILLAPDFLFRIEVGDVDAKNKRIAILNPWEIASRLSYFLWQSMPDATLFESARKGLLANANEVKAQAERMLADPKAHATVKHFHEQWLGLQPLAAGALNKDKSMYPQWSPTLAKAMHDDVTRLIDDVIFAGAGGFEALFQSRVGYVDTGLEAIYETKGRTGRIELGAERGAGVLARAALLATYAHHNQSSPTRRGVFVRKQLLCQNLPPPPPNVNNVLSDPNPSQTTRERLARHASDPSCAGCHRLVDPIGLAFENFDAVGAWRDQESGKPIDAGGELVNTVGIDGTFVGLAALGKQLSQSEMAQECLSRQWLRFAHGREEGADDVEVIASMKDSLRASKGNVLQLLLVLATSPGFVTRPMQESSP